jgi:2-polyprenyl-3-methyl-5-hydroxy-6-metoxy-1,4-benzoquinol methylase
LADRVVEFDPRTKFCLYARKLPEGARAPVHQPARVPRRPEGMADVSDAIAEELESLDAAPRKSAWVFDTFAELVPGADVLEVGAGIGTFTRLMLGAGAKQVMAIEPEAACADVLERDLADEPKLRVRREALPDAPSLAGETFDLVVCDNVLEHIGDEAGALSVMVAALRPGGHLVLVVPAGPRLFGALDDAYGHWRRYGEADVRQVVGAAGLRIESLQAINALGIPGWWAKNRRPGARVGPLAIRINDVMLAMWRPIEERLKPPFGLSLVCIAVKPV